MKGRAPSGFTMPHPGTFDVARFSKLCQMLSSPSDGERANAANMATAMLKSANLTWEQIVSSAFTFEIGKNKRSQQDKPKPKPKPRPERSQNKPQQTPHNPYQATGNPRSRTFSGIEAAELVMVIHAELGKLGEWQSVFITDLHRNLMASIHQPFTLTERQWGALLSAGIGRGWIGVKVDEASNLKTYHWLKQPNVVPPQEPEFTRQPGFTRQRHSSQHNDRRPGDQTFWTPPTRRPPL